MKLILFITAIFLTLFSDAQDWQQVGSGIDGNVICMAELGGKIYVGGNYTGDLNYISQWDPATQQWTDISNGFISYAIMGMTVHEGKLYVSGLYQWTSGDIVASYDPLSNTWEGLGDADGVSAISELFIHNNYLYIGGNGYSKKLDLGTGVWSDMAETANAAQVRGFADVGGEIFVHKEESADTWDNYSFLTFDDNSFSFTGEALDGLTYNWFQDLEVVGTDIYCVGGFYIDTDFQRIAKYDTQTGIYSGLPGCPESASYTALHHNGKIYFGGSFQSQYEHVVAYTIADGSWSSVGSGLPGQVQDMVVLDDTLYAIGNFSNPIMHVAKFDLTPAVSINEIPTADLRVYPNPCEDVLYFNEQISNEVVNVYDISGKAVLSEMISNNRLDMADLAPGIYIVIIEGNGRSNVVVRR